MGGGSAEGWEGGEGVPYDGLKPIVLELFILFLPHLQHMLSVLCEAKCQVVLPEVSMRKMGPVRIQERDQKVWLGHLNVGGHQPLLQNLYYSDKARTSGRIDYLNGGWRQ